MSEKDGWETIVELGQDFPDCRNIAISGGARTGPYGYLALAKRFGAQRVFAKPIQKRELLQAVRELLEERGGRPYRPAVESTLPHPRRSSQ